MSRLHKLELTKKGQAEAQRDQWTRAMDSFLGSNIELLGIIEDGDTQSLLLKETGERPHDERHYTPKMIAFSRDQITDNFASAEELDGNEL